MKIDEITEGVSPSYKAEQKLNHKQYRRLVSRMKKAGSGGDKLAKQALRTLMKTWKKGDKVVGNYKKILDDVNVPYDDIL